MTRSQPLDAGHLATGLGGGSASLGAGAHPLVVVALALLRAQVAGLGAEAAELRGEVRAARHQRQAQGAEGGAVQAKPDAGRHLAVTSLYALLGAGLTSQAATQSAQASRHCRVVSSVMRVVAIVDISVLGGRGDGRACPWRKVKRGVQPVARLPAHRGAGEPPRRERPETAGPSHRSATLVRDSRRGRAEPWTRGESNP